jgi:hypothetical protein
MGPENEIRPNVLLDAPERPGVSVPLLPELAVVSTLVLIAAPIVVVGATAVMALSKKVRGDLR